MRSIFRQQFGIVRMNRVSQNRKARSRRLAPSVDGLERRELLTGGGTVSLSGSAVTVIPALGAATVTVSYQQVSGVTKLDVNLNGADNFFALGQVTMVDFAGENNSGNETFTNNTHVMTVAYGGSGTNVFQGGSGSDEFVGGSGSNTFDAGTGFDIMMGGSGTNIYKQSATGSGLILEAGTSNTIDPPGATAGHYSVY